MGLLITVESSTAAQWGGWIARYNVNGHITTLYDASPANHSNQHFVHWLVVKAVYKIQKH